MTLAEDSVAAVRGNDRNSGYERKSLDWYCENETPVEQLLDHEDFTGHLIYDPSCGRGNILDVCAARGMDTVGSDVVDRGARARHDFYLRDYLTDQAVQPCEYVAARLAVHHASGAKTAIINNPPYGRPYGGADFRKRYPTVEDWLRIVPFEHGQPDQLSRDEFLSSTPEWMGKPDGGEGTLTASPPPP